MYFLYTLYSSAILFSSQYLQNKIMRRSRSLTYTQDLVFSLNLAKVHLISNIEVEKYVQIRNLTRFLDSLMFG